MELWVLVRGQIPGNGVMSRRWRNGINYIGWVNDGWMVANGADKQPNFMLTSVDPFSEGPGFASQGFVCL
jgi:hypothetical protein